MTTTPDLSHARWRKSSYSNGGGGNCIECTSDFVASGFVLVRDSKNKTGPSLAFAVEQWTAFVGALANGEFGGV